jgi:hypothetical protein
MIDKDKQLPEPPEGSEDLTPAWDVEEMADEMEATYVDPFEDWYAPGYPTAMDELNALEANDYIHEFDDIDYE